MGSCVSHPIANDQHLTANPARVVAGVGVEPEHHNVKDFIPSVLLHHSGRTDESFFDAQTWIEYSDCDDEFHSTNGGDYSTSPPTIPCIHHRRFSTGTVPDLLLTPSPFDSNVPRLLKVSSAPSRTNSSTTPLNDIIFAAGTVLKSNEVLAHNKLSAYMPDISPMDKRKRLLELFRLSRGRFGDDHFLNENNIISTTATTTKTGSGPGSTHTSCGPFTSIATSVCSCKRASNASNKCRRSIKAVHPIECLRKLRTGRHKNEKKMMEVNDVDQALDE